MPSKKILRKIQSPQRHWVGDGFHVQGFLRPNEALNGLTTPFLMLDYASPLNFSSSKKPRGVGPHPHRGFETVTLAYQGEIEHRDSAGGGGIIRPGDVQWMTAGRGLVHDEFHSKEFTKNGGLFEMIQLWINLPKKFKMTEPKYQSLQKQEIPYLKIGNSSKLRVIAGAYKNIRGSAKTFTDVNVFDINSNGADDLSIEFHEGFNTIFLIMHGSVEIEGKPYNNNTMLVFDNKECNLNLSTSSDFKGLFLSARPINEPIAAYGPFVMNTDKEIKEAITDYNNGIMGVL